MTGTGVFVRWATERFDNAMALNLANVERALSAAPAHGSLLDLGCADGERTMTFARAARTASIHGVEVTTEHAEAARSRGIEVVESDLNAELPFADASFDVVVSNQVIEHLSDTDTFVREIRRVLRSGGLAVTSTENLASWHNLGALLLGWQPFSLTNVSTTRCGIGNPVALHRGEEPELRSWEHLRVFAYRGLRELFEAHGFTIRKVFGAGYYPLPARAGVWEPRHAAFLTVAASG
ncbi:MAG: class I SAM-dependent methyltransferase [Actinobacteria bacterium]|nr:class I SAM-dependent methyltransferase [Actinomycetota bacterium]